VVSIALARKSSLETYLVYTLMVKSEAYSILAFQKTFPQDWKTANFAAIIASGPWRSESVYLR
jgi:hypothetical protein